MQTSWSYDHVTRNQDWNMILKSQKRSDMSVTQLNLSQGTYTIGIKSNDATKPINLW